MRTIFLSVGRPPALLDVCGDQHSLRIARLAPDGSASNEVTLAEDEITGLLGMLIQLEGPREAVLSEWLNKRLQPGAARDVAREAFRVLFAAGQQPK